HPRSHQGLCGDSRSRLSSRAKPCLRRATTKTPPLSIPTSSEISRSTSPQRIPSAPALRLIQRWRRDASTTAGGTPALRTATGRRNRRLDRLLILFPLLP